MSGKGAQPVSGAAYGLLGAMTAITFAGPLGLAWLLSGGERRGWPPDRAVEWTGTIGLLAAFAVVLVACLTVRRWLLKPAPRDDRPTGS
jgi:hypothetical protein